MLDIEQHRALEENCEMEYEENNDPKVHTTNNRYYLYSYELWRFVCHNLKNLLQTGSDLKSHIYFQ